MSAGCRINAAVTQEPAEALLKQSDVCSLRIVLAALIDADDDTGDQLDVAINDVCCQPEEGLERLGKQASDAGVG